MFSFIKKFFWPIPPDDLPNQSVFKISKEPDMEEGAKRIYAHLEQLGSTPSKVAEFLETHQVKGKVRDCFDCPIANWIKTLVADKPDYRTHVTVSQNTFTVSYIGKEDKYQFIMGARGYLPHAIREFMYYFDYKDCYPHLVGEPTSCL